MLITPYFSLRAAAFVCDDLHHPASYAFARCFSKQQSRNGADGCAESHRIAASALDEAGRDDMGRIVAGIRRAPAKGGCARVCAVLSHRGGRQRWFTIGRHGAPWTPEAAREEARRLLGDVAHQRDPAAEKRAARNAQTVAELCDLYLADAEAGRLLTRRRTQKKASTLAIDKGRIARHIKPLLGQLRVAAVTLGDVECFMHDVAEGKTAGNTNTN